MASALSNLSNAQAAPTSRFARDIRVHWRVPLPFHLFEIRVTPQRMLHAVLDRMKCEAEQGAEERLADGGKWTHCGAIAGRCALKIYF